MFSHFGYETASNQGLVNNVDDIARKKRPRTKMIKSCSLGTSMNARRCISDPAPILTVKQFSADLQAGGCSSWVNRVVLTVTGDFRSAPINGHRLNSSIGPVRIPIPATERGDLAPSGAK
jgi:hypothetical protein